METKKAKRVDYFYGDGTCLKGKVSIRYEKLVELFGEPECGDDYETDAEWVVMFGNEVFTIYNWKNGKNYAGEFGDEVHNIVHWNIGGKTWAGDFIEYLENISSIPELKKINNITL